MKRRNVSFRAKFTRHWELSSSFNFQYYNCLLIRYNQEDHNPQVRTLSLIIVTFTYLLVGAAIFDYLEGDNNEKAYKVTDLSGPHGEDSGDDGC